MATFTPQQFTKRLDGIRKQGAFAMSKAINDTAKDFQRSQLRHQGNVFTVRNPTFMNRSVKIAPFATKARLEATVSIEPPGGRRTADILGKFEEGGLKKPRDGSHLAVPVGVRRGKTGKISKALRPKAFRFHNVGEAIRGLKRAFIIPNVGIFQRTGKRTIKMLYAFPKMVRIPAMLRFKENARKVVKRRFKKHFEEAYRFALKTAR